MQSVTSGEKFINSYNYKIVLKEELLKKLTRAFLYYTVLQINEKLIQEIMRSSLLYLCTCIALSNLLSMLKAEFAKSDMLPTHIVYIRVFCSCRYYTLVYRALKKTPSVLPATTDIMYLRYVASVIFLWL